jgi:hypothetical protein
MSTHIAQPRTLVILIALITGVFFLPELSHCELTRQVNLTRIKEAIHRRVRFEVFWWSQVPEPGPGNVCRLEVATDGQHFVAIVDPIRQLADGRREVAIFEGKQGATRTWITSRSGTPVRPHEAIIEGRLWWTAMRTKLDEPFLVVDELYLTTSPFSAPPPDREDHVRIRNALLEAVRATLRSDANLVGRTMGASITLIVPPFNVDDPLVYVLVADTDTVYEVEVYDPFDTTDPRFRAGGDMLARPFAGSVESQRDIGARIRRFGKPFTVAP